MDPWYGTQKEESNINVNCQIHGWNNRNPRLAAQEGTPLRKAKTDIKHLYVMNTW